MGMRPIGQFAPLGPPSAGAARITIRTVNQINGATNCVNCVIATHATLSGRPAGAAPSGPQPISVLENYFASKFQNVRDRSAIEAALTQAGPGAQGVVFGSRGTGVGHERFTDRRPRR